MTNIISAVVYGHRFSINDVTFQDLIKCNHCIVENLGSTWARVSHNRMYDHKFNLSFISVNTIDYYTDKELSLIYIFSTRRAPIHSNLYIQGYNTILHTVLRLFYQFKIMSLITT